MSRKEDGFYVREEIGTSNGTFVNGEQIETGVPVEIEDGDEIRFRPRQDDLPRRVAGCQGRNGR
ncbi:MAG: FHA domain-containing protein [Acidobacteriota bacterium]